MELRQCASFRLLRPVNAGKQIADAAAALVPTLKTQGSAAGTGAIGAPEAAVASSIVAPIVGNRLATGFAAPTDSGGGASLTVRGPQVVAAPRQSGIAAAARTTAGPSGGTLAASASPAPKTDLGSGILGSPNVAQQIATSAPIATGTEKRIAATASAGAQAGRLGGTATGNNVGSTPTANVALSSAPINAGAASGLPSALGASPGIGFGVGQLASADIKPQVALSVLTGPLGPTKSIAPDLAFIRSPERREPMLQEFGGTKELGRRRFARMLAYLASRAGI